MSFHAWKIFQRFLAESPHPQSQRTPFEIRLHQREIEEPTAPLNEYIKPLISPKFEFIAHLILAGGVRLSASELSRILPQLMNLGVLEIIQPQDPVMESMFPRITDSVVRGWSQIPGVFPCLRVLRIWGEDFTTIHSIKDVTKFPALTVYDIAGRSKDIYYRRHKNLHWKKSSVPKWMQYQGWASEAGHKPKTHPTEWMFSTKCWSSDRSSGRRPVSMVFEALNAEADRALVVDNNGPGWLHTAVRNTDTHVQFVPEQEVEKRVSWLVSYYKTDETAMLSCFSDWGYILYSEIGKIRGEADLRAQGLSADRRAVLSHHRPNSWHSGPFRHIVASRPFATLSLGRLGGTRPYFPPAEEMEAHVTFVRVVAPPAAGTTSTSSEEPRQSGPLKRSAEGRSEFRAVRRQRSQNIGDLLNQFGTT